MEEYVPIVSENVLGRRGVSSILSPMSSTLVQFSPSWLENIDGDVRVCTQGNIYDILICIAHMKNVIIDTGTSFVEIIKADLGGV